MKTSPLSLAKGILSWTTFRLISLFLILTLANPARGQSPLDLLPINQATHVVQNSGNWTDASTWTGGIIPTNGAKVLIPSGLTLTVNDNFSARIKIIRIQGKMNFSTTVNTTLNVETIIQDMTGELEIGTSSTPIPSAVTCRINLIDEGNIDISGGQFEKGMVLMGKTVAYGADKTDWTRLTVNPTIGATTLDLQVQPIGWEAGDRIVITGTDPLDPTSDEVATIQSVSGNTVTLSQGLTKNHTTPDPSLFVHVANLNRNIVIESENSAIMERGHIMFMHTHDVDFNHVRVHKLGRTRKDVPIDDWSIDENDQFVNGPRTNVRGRYSIHFHRGGTTPNSSASVKGCVVEDDLGWAYVNHSSNVLMEDNVSYNVIGGAFQSEAGDELGSFKHNIAIRTVNPAFPLLLPAPDNAPDTQENSQDFAFQGDGFWVHGGGVSLEENVASGCSGHGFIYWPEGLIEPGQPSGTFMNTFQPANLGLPNSVNLTDPVIATGWVKVAGFKNNETYSSTIGFASYYLHTTFFGDRSDYDPAYIDTLHSTFDGFTAWNIRTDGMQLHYTERITFKNVKLINNDGNANSHGIWASHFRAQNKHIYKNIHIQGFGTGFALPPQGQVTVDNGYMKNGINFLVPNPRKAPRDMTISCMTTETDPAFTNPIEILMDTSFANPDNKFPAYILLPDKTILNYGSFNNQRLYFDQQDANFIPLPVDAAPYTFEEGGDRVILAEFALKSNQQLQNDYQMSFCGSLMPMDAVSSPGIVGGKIRAWQSETLNVPVCIESGMDPEIDVINQCLQGASNKVLGPLPTYTHAVSNPCSFSVGIEENTLENLISVFPNPTHGKITVRGPLDDYNIRVFDINGTLIKVQNEMGNQFVVDLSRQPTGMYFLHVLSETSGRVETSKIIKSD